MEPVWDGVSRQISLRPRGVSGGLHGTQACGAASWWGGALLSAEHPLLCLGPPLLTTLHTDARGYRTYGDQLTGKRRQRAQPRGRLCVRRHPALPPDRLSVGITVGGAWAYPFFLAEFSNFSWKLLRRSCFSPNHFIKVVWCRLFRADQVVETSAPLCWISSLPKSGMFSPGK